MKKIISALMIIAFSTYCNAQKKAELVNDNIAVISYSVSKKEIKLSIKTNGGTPQIKVDVNKNGSIDNMVDRSYGIADGGGFILCKQFLIDEKTSTHCSGAPSKARLSGERFNYVFTIPVKELITPIDPEKIHVQFEIWSQVNGAWKFYRYPYSSASFGNVFKIDIK
jgi:hypothetical protein